MKCDSSETASTSKTKSSLQNGAPIMLQGQFRVCSLQEQHSDYNIYQAIDLINSRWVSVYLKQKSNACSFSKNVREPQRSQICPKVLLSGEIDIGKLQYAYQVHEKYGPSLESLFAKIKPQITPKDLLHLLLEMLKLVQKLDSLKMVSGELTLKSIVFDLTPKRNDLYLLNCFTLKKRHQERKTIHSRYCSRGAHLGRQISIKDDLESVCYILIDIFTEGGFLREKMPQEYKEEKLSLKIEEFAEGLPESFLQFYHYVINLNYADDINYFYWKNHLTKILTPEVLSRPYRFLMAKSGGLSKSEDVETDAENEIEDLIELFEDYDCEEMGSKLTKVERTISSNEKFKRRE